MISGPPPSRYKVIEQGRRLVVIDNLTGAPVTRRAPSANEPVAPPSSIDAGPLSTAPRRVDDRSGLPVFTTLPIYDLNGPREIVLSEATQRTLTGAGFVAAMIVLVWFIVAFTWPIGAFVALFVVFQPKAVKGYRQWITTQLDKSV